MCQLLSAVVLVLAVGFVSAGIIDPVEKCVGLGFVGPITFTDCTTPPCVVVVGRSYDMEFEFLSTADHAELTMKITVFLMEGPIVIYETPIPGSSVIAGRTYNLEDSYVPDDGLLNRTFDLELELLDSKTQDKIICAKAPFTVVAA